VISALPTSLALIFASIGCVENSFFDTDDRVDSVLIIEETFEQAPLPAVDILWVVDNTASMGEEQAGLADGFADFLSSLEEASLAYQVGVVTTDPENGDGAVLQGDPWIITPELDDPVAAFAQAVSVGLDGTVQAGLAAMVSALSEPLRSAQNRGFRRPQAALLVVVVSDEDDMSQGLLDGDPVQEALAFLADQATPEGQPARLTAIVGDDPGGCTGDAGSALAGTAYAQVAKSSGGELVSICSANLDGLVGSLGELAVSWPTTFSLQADPVADSVQVTVDGKRDDEIWTLVFTPPAIVFNVPPAPGAWIVVTYEIASPSEE
jgi:hypothetical protein